MAYFISLSSKFERAVRALMILQGKATWNDAFISNDSRKRTLPNRIFIVSAFSRTRAWRPEGVCQMQIQHHLSASAQPNELITQPGVGLDDYLGDTYDTLNLGGQAEATDMKALADAITQSGRWLATPDTDSTGQEAIDAAAIVAANQGMDNFRCDWVKMSNPELTRGNDTSTTNWVEIIHLSAFVSHSNAALPN